MKKVWSLPGRNRPSVLGRTVRSPVPSRAPLVPGVGLGAAQLSWFGHTVNMSLSDVSLSCIVGTALGLVVMAEMAGYPPKT